MTCNTCDKGRDEAKKTWNDAHWKARLAALRRCRPWCGQCGPCADPCGSGIGARPIIEAEVVEDDRVITTALRQACIDPATGKPGTVEVYYDATGKQQTRCVLNPNGGFNPNPGPRPYPTPRPCDDPSILCRAVFGHHWNEEVVASDFSPAAVEAIIKGYGQNTVNGIAFAVPGSPGWYAIRVGGLGVSHDFCIEEVSAYIIDAIGVLVPIPIGNVAVAGERITCDPDQQGFWQHAIDSAVQGNPAGLDITPFRCKCPPSLCTDTPARGSEFIFVQTALPALVIGARVTRGDWLKTVDVCVPAIGNRIAVAPQNLSVDPGDVAFLP